MQKKPSKYPKPSLELDGQLQLLSSRGLIITDSDAAKRQLLYRNYYRISGYSYPLLRDCSSPSNEKCFCNHTTLEQVMRIYDFDSKFRSLISQALETIEIALRSTIAYYLAKAHGTHAHLIKGLYRFRNRDEEKQFFEGLEKEISRSKEVFIQHIHNKYNGDWLDVPVWAAVEVLPFGSLSFLYKFLKHSDEKIAVANSFGISKTSVFQSILHHINYVRNLCAHHSRLWNKEMRVSPKIPNDHSIQSLCPEVSRNKVYASLILCDYLLKVIEPDNSWLLQIKEYLDEYPDIPKDAMGFPDQWESMKPWSDLL